VNDSVTGSIVDLVQGRCLTDCPVRHLARERATAVVERVLEGDDPQVLLDDLRRTWQDADDPPPELEWRERSADELLDDLRVCTHAVAMR